MAAVTLDHLGDGQSAALRQPLEFRPHPGVVPGRQAVAATTAAGIRLQTVERFGDQLPGLCRQQPAQVVVHQQRGIGRYQVNQTEAEALAQTPRGRQHPRHVRLVDGVEQADHQAVDGNDFDANPHTGRNSPRATRIRCTAAIELSLSPCTQIVSTRRLRALPSLAIRSSPRARVTAWLITVSGS